MDKTRFQNDIKELQELIDSLQQDFSKSNTVIEVQTNILLLSVTMTTVIKKQNDFIISLLENQKNDGIG